MAQLLELSPIHMETLKTTQNAVVAIPGQNVKLKLCRKKTPKTLKEKLVHSM